MALTKGAIDRAEYDPAGPKTQVHYDGAEIPGFGVRVHPPGMKTGQSRKTFVLTYRTRGRPAPKRITIGTYGPMTLDEARKLARQTLLEAKTGEDPLEARRKQRVGDTVRDLARVYMERHARPHKRSWREDERRINKYIVPALGSKRIEDVKRTDVARLHCKMGETHPVGANRLLSQLQTMFNLAADWGLLAEGAPNPATRIVRFKERSRDRWVTPAELPALWEAIEQESSPYLRAAFKLYLFTGLRRNELLGLRWKDIDLVRGEIRLGDTKAGRAHVVAISAPAREVLRDLPRQLGNAYLFPGDMPGKPLVNVSKPWLRIRARFWLAGNPEAAAELRARAETDIARRNKHAEKGPEAVEARLLTLAKQAAKGDEDVRLHDLRRTVGSWLATSGASLPLIGKVLNHTNASTTQVYARLAESATRIALEEHGAHIVAVLSGESRAV